LQQLRGVEILPLNQRAHDLLDAGRGLAEFGFMAAQIGAGLGRIVFQFLGDFAARLLDSVRGRVHGQALLHAAQPVPVRTSHRRARAAQAFRHGQ
jgi:hypothetical protein